MADLSGNDRLLVEVITAAVLNETISDDAQHWIKQATLRHFMHGDDLSTCLGISSTRGRLLRNERDAFIRQAVGLLPGDSLSARVRAFHSQLNRFANTKWQTWRDSPPEAIEDRLERCYYNVLRFESIGIKIPSENTCRSICAAENSSEKVSIPHSKVAP